MKALLQAVVIVLMCGVATAEEQTWTPNFRDAEIREVIHEVGAALGIAVVVVDPVVKGRVDVYSRVPLNREQYYSLFLNMLDVNGFAAINSDGVLRIVPAKEARTAPASPPADSGFRSGHVTEIIRLKHISAAKILPSIRPLIAPQNSHLAPYGNSALIISDTRENVKRIRALLRQLDTASKVETELIKLRYAYAGELVDTLDQLQRNNKADAQQQQQLVLVPDSRTNSILVRGDELAREEVKSLILQLDRPGPQTGSIRTVYLQHASAETLEGVLNGVISNIEQNAQASGAAQQVRSSVVADLDTNSLIITAQGETLESLYCKVYRLLQGKWNAISIPSAPLAAAVRCLLCQFG